MIVKVQVLYNKGMPIFGEDEKLTVRLDLDTTEAEYKLNLLKQKVLIDFQSALLPVVQQLRQVSIGLSPAGFAQGIPTAQLGAAYYAAATGPAVLPSGTPVFAPPPVTPLAYMAQFSPSAFRAMLAPLTNLPPMKQQMTLVDLGLDLFQIYTQTWWAKPLQALRWGIGGTALFAGAAGAFGADPLKVADESLKSFIGTNLIGQGDAAGWAKFILSSLGGAAFLTSGVATAVGATGVAAATTPIGWLLLVAAGLISLGQYLYPKGKRWWIKKYGTREDWQEYIRREEYGIDKNIQQQLEAIAKGLSLPSSSITIDVAYESTQQMKQLLEQFAKWSEKPEDMAKIMEEINRQIGPLLQTWRGVRGPFKMEDIAYMMHHVIAMKTIPEASKEQLNILTERVREGITKLRQQLERVYVQPAPELPEFPGMQTGALPGKIDVTKYDVVMLTKSPEEMAREILIRAGVTKELMPAAHYMMSQAIRFATKSTKDINERLKKVAEAMPSLYKSLQEFMVRSGQIHPMMSTQAIMQKLDQWAQMITEIAVFEGRSPEDVFRDFQNLYQRFGIAHPTYALNVKAVLEQTAAMVGMPVLSTIAPAEHLRRMLLTMDLIPKAGSTAEYGRLMTELTAGAGGYLKSIVAQMQRNYDFHQLAMYQLGGPIAATQRMMTATAQFLTSSPITQLAALHYSQYSHAPVGGLGGLALSVGNITSLEDYLKFRRRLKEGTAKTLMHSEKALQSMRFVIKQFLTATNTPFTKENVAGLLEEVFRFDSSTANLLAYRLTDQSPVKLEEEVEAVTKVRSAIVQAGQREFRRKFDQMIIDAATIDAINKAEDSAKVLETLQDRAISLAGLKETFRGREYLIQEILPKLKQKLKGLKPEEIDVKKLVPILRKEIIAELGVRGWTQEDIRKHFREIEKMVFGVAQFVEDVARQGKLDVLQQGWITTLDIAEAQRMSKADINKELIQTAKENAESVDIKLSDDEYKKASILSLRKIEEHTRVIAESVKQQ